MKEGEQNIPEPYRAKVKLFSERAERVSKVEYGPIVEELQRTLGGSLHSIRAAEQLYISAMKYYGNC